MNTLFFWLSKLVWLAVCPGNLLVILVVTAVVLLWRGKQRRAKWLLSIVAVFMLIVAWLPVGEWVLYPLEARFPANPILPDKIDGIIVLGGAEEALRSQAWNQSEMNAASERLCATLSLARRYPEARVVYTGGSGWLLRQALKGADVAQAVFKEQGLDPNRVTLERESRNTAENVTLCRQILKPAPGENWIVITSASHMPRAVGLFRRAGWPVIPYPVDHWTEPGRLLRLEFSFHDHLFNLTTGMKEWVGLTVGYVTGKTDSFLPGANARSTPCPGP